MQTPRFFLDIDEDCHYVIVPVEKRRSWNSWLKKHSNEYNPTLPDYVDVVVVSDMRKIEFSDYIIKK